MSNVPKLRFKEFSGEWVTKKLFQVSAMKAGKFVKSSDILDSQENNTYPCYGGNGLRGYTTTHTHEGTYSLIGRQGALCGNVQLAKGKFHATEHAVVVTPTNKNDTLWLYYELNRLNLNRFATGQAQPGLSVEVIKQVKTSIPSKQEQEKIALFLTSVDTKIELLTKKEELLKQYKKGVMQKIFSREIRFKRENGSEFEDWEEKKLGDLCKVAKSGGTPTSTNKEYYDGDIPFLAISDITTQGKYITYTSKTVSQKGIDNSTSWLVPEDTIIYSMYASVGFVSINKIPLATSQAVINLILKDEANTEFIYYYLLDYKQYIHRFIETGTQGNLNAQTVKSLKIKLPSLQEQTKIANFLSSIDSKIEQVQKQLDSTKEFKKALLQQMFV
jgi:type I restriction enzyme S subunit